MTRALTTTVWAPALAAMVCLMLGCVTGEMASEPEVDELAFAVEDFGAADVVHASYQGEIERDEPQACGSRGLPRCGAGLYCDWEADLVACGATDRPGVCREIPMTCTADYNPVCGCDGETYSNDCVAASNGVDVASEGACEDEGAGLGDVCGGIMGVVCGAGLVCDHSDVPGCFIADAQGVCVTDEASDCTGADYAPVCGCDGVEYVNDCERRDALVPLANEGFCISQQGETCGGIAARECDEGLVCDFSGLDQCFIRDPFGVCIVDEVVACTREYFPVCGCDGVTYGNDCERRKALVPLAHEGHCPGQEEEWCGGILGRECDAGLVCDYSDVPGCGISDATGACIVDELVACTREYFPVCGCDGVTYGNDCERRKALVPLDHRGACR